MEKSIGDIVKDFLKDKVARWILIAILVFFLVTLIWSYKDHRNRIAKNQHSKFFWDEYFPIPDLDTQEAQRKPAKYQDSTYDVKKTVEVKSSKPTIAQKNKRGNNQANVNSGTNNGSIGNDNKNHIVHGDNNGINGDVTVERVLLSKDEKAKLLADIEHVRTTNGLNRKIVVKTWWNLTNPDYAQQVTDFLQFEAYAVMTSPAEGSIPFYGCKVFRSDTTSSFHDWVTVSVGMFPRLK